MSEYSDLIGSSFGRANPALPQTVGNIDEDPERAAKALDLAKATGIPGTAIFGDLDEFERQHKATLASDIVANNPHLGDFVGANPLNPKIANDDYGNLDAVSQKVSALDLPMRALRAPERLANLLFPGDPLKHFTEGGQLGSWLRSEDVKNYPVSSAIAAGLGTPVELLFRGVGGTIETLAEGATNVADTAGAPGLGRDIGGIIQTEGMGLSGRHGVHGPRTEGEAFNAINAPAVSKLFEQHERVRPYLENGREPPVGVLPEYDTYRTKQNAEDLTALKDATSDAQQSLLRERNPELFRQFIAQHTDAEIGVSGEVVAAMYGDKVPAVDDGLLGWVPGIQDKLALARDTGGEVSIPLADWLAHAEPEVMQALHDDIRVRPGGITANESKLAKEAEAANPASEPIAEEVPTTRAASALEPMFSVGDRKLKLERLKQAAPEQSPHFGKDPQQLAEADGLNWNDLSSYERARYEDASRGTQATKFGPEQGFHDFQMLDEKGNPVGYINLSTQEGSKKLYVDMISGVNGLGPRDFGPALMRSLLQQLKEEFPEAESITGHRVSGAREKAGSYMASSASPVVKLDSPDISEIRKVLSGGEWQQYSRNVQAYIKPQFGRAARDRQLINVIEQELDRIVPNKIQIQEAQRIEARGVEGQGAAPVEPTGTYITYNDAYPILLYSLEGKDPLGTARHEAIHHLRTYGFFDKMEWATLERASMEHDWLQQFDIPGRYPKLDHPLRLEESIADAYKEWEAGRLESITPEAVTIFQKMKEFFDRIKQRIGELLGKPPTWEDIFQKVSTGEVGGREGTTPLDPRAFNEKLSVEPPEGGSRIFERAAALGMTVDQFKRYDELIAKRHAEDIAAATKRATDQKARELTQTWKNDRKDLRQDVAAEIKQRPDVAADLFFGAGELYGKKVPLGSVKMDASLLSAEQKAGLPRSYYGEHGMHPDDVANLFGYGSGDAMVERLVQYNAAKLAAKMAAKDFVSRVTDIETDRQMRLKYGVLEDNIMDAVKEQVAGSTQLDILAEETHALGMKIGQAPLDKTAIVTELKDKFAKMPLGSVSSDAYLRASGKAGRQAEMALLAEDPAAAFRAKQQQWYATVIAKEAVALEKDLDRFDKVAKRFSKREVAAVAPEYTNFIHDILQRVGKQVRRSVQDIETEIAAGEYHSLTDFVDGKNGFYLREVAVADILLDPAFRKKFEDLTVDEFNAVNTSIKSMVANGRDELKITKAGVAADLAEVKGQMINQLAEFQEKTYDVKGGRWMGPIPPKLAKTLRSYGIAHIQMENLFNRWDHDNPQGVFQQYIMRDLVDAANNESVMEKRYAARLRDIDDKADLKKSVDNQIFKVPNSDQLMKFNRGNLRTVLLNAGNKSNLDKMARGYKLEPEQVLQWIDQHATKEDWDWAQRMGDVFAEIKAEADTMYRHLSGVAPASIRIEPITTPHGQYPGWYYPIMYHPEFEGASKKLMGKDALEQEGFVRATTSNGYTQARTGYAGPMALDLDMLPARMKQMIHDIAMRPSVINASKIFYDKDVRAAVGKHFGNEWRDMLVPYLVDVSNSANYLPKDQRMFMQASEFVRQNMISTLVGLNPGTVLKHGPTALVQSLHEVGAIPFLKSMKSLFSINERTGETNWQFAMKESEELQRRHQNYTETLGGATALLQPKEGFASLRSTVQRFSAQPVAISDLLSAVPTWLAQYERSMTDNGGIHGDAVYDANRAVRRAHGSVAITNRSSVMRGGALSQWFASVYGFFNHIMNRQYELLWKSGEALGLAKEGNYREAMQRAPELTSMLFAYVVAPALIEEAVTPLMSDDKESWGKKAAKGLAFTLGASWVGVRDVVNALLNNRDPSAGLVSTGLKTITDPFRDLAKKAPFSREHAGKIVRDGATMLGALTGVVPAQVGKAAQFGYGVQQGTERPKGPWGWMTGMRFGTLKNHPATFAEWQKHHLGGH